MRENEVNRTPQFGETVNTMIERKIMDLNVSMPAEIVTYDPDTQMADVLPSLLAKYEDGTLKPLPIIPNVPVKQLRGVGGTVRIHIPLAPGDEVQLVFSQRSLDNWKSQGGLTDPKDRRRMHLADAVAYIGGASEAQAFPVDDPLAIEIVNGDSVIQIKPTGQIKIGNTATELIDQLVTLVQTLSTASTVVGGPFIATVVAQLEEIQANLETLKVSG